MSGGSNLGDTATAGLDGTNVVLDVLGSPSAPARSLPDPNPALSTTIG